MGVLNVCCLGLQKELDTRALPIFRLIPSEVRGGRGVGGREWGWAHCSREAELIRG